jgi:RNA polymerase sigma-70 factor (ECF subfamily)
LLAYRYRASFRGDAHYRTWLYRIAATTALGYLRRTKRAGLRRAANDDVATLQIADPASSPEEVMAGAESRERVRGALAKLEPKYRDVLLARADRSEIETAAELGISVANVKIRAHRARKQLRDVLETMAA